MRLRPNRLGQLGVDQILKGTLHQLTKQITNPVTTKFCDQLTNSCIMFTGHRVTPLELVV